jgi:hypothetical protein
MPRKHYQFQRTTNPTAAFIERYITWKLDNKGGCGPAGFDFDLSQPETNKITAMLDPLLDGIADNGIVTDSWVPANDFQARRLARAYTDRGLKAA